MGSNIVEAKKEGILLGIEGVFSHFRRFPAQLRRFPAHFRQFAAQFRRFYTFWAHLLCIFGVVFYAGPNVLWDFRGAFHFSWTFSIFDDFVPPRVNFVISLKWA